MMAGRFRTFLSKAASAISVAFSIGISPSETCPSKYSTAISISLSKSSSSPVEGGVT